MRLKLDENLGRRTAEALRQAGHDVMTVPDQRLEGTPDPELIEECRGEERCLVILDLGFGNPLVFRPSRYHGIAVLRLPARASSKDLDETVQTLIGGLEREDIGGKLWIVQLGRIRHYQEEYDGG